LVLQGLAGSLPAAGIRDVEGLAPWTNLLPYTTLFRPLRRVRPRRRPCAPSRPTTSSSRRLPQGRWTPRPYGPPGVAGGALPPGAGARQGFIGGRDTCPHVLLPLRVGGARDRGVRVVEVEGRTLRTDPRQRREVVRRRWARGRPLQRTAVPPRVVDPHHRCLLRGDVDIPEEEQGGGGQDEGRDRGDL